MNQNKISIIIPTFNAEKTIVKAIDSVLNQTYQNFELIIVNDGSSDKSYEIIEQYAHQDDRIILVNQRNQGVSKARNNGLNIATGSYITFVDSDDYICPDFCSKMIEKIKETNADIIKCTYRTEWENGDGDNWYFSLGGCEYFSKDFIQTSVISSLLGLSNHNLVRWLNGEDLNAYYFACTTCYKKELIEQYNLHFNENLKIGEDLIFNLMAFYYAKNLAIINEPLYRWVNNSSSMTRKQDIKLNRYKLDCIKERQYLCNEFKLGEEYHQCYRNQAIMLGLYQIKYLSLLGKEYTFKDMLEINQVSKFKVCVPKYAIKMLHSMNKVSIKKQFIDENSIKLVTDNIYSSEKIRTNIKINHKLSDVRY